MALRPTFVQALHCAAKGTFRAIANPNADIRSVNIEFAQATENRHFVEDTKSLRWQQPANPPCSIQDHDEQCRRRLRQVVRLFSKTHGRLDSAASAAYTLEKGVNSPKTNLPSHRKLTLSTSITSSEKLRPTPGVRLAALICGNDHLSTFCYPFVMV